MKGTNSNYAWVEKNISKIYKPELHGFEEIENIKKVKSF